MTEDWDGKEIVVIVIGVIGQTGGMSRGIIRNYASVVEVGSEGSGSPVGKSP